MMAKLKRTYQSHFLIRSASPSAHARATAEPAFSCPGILSQPPFSMTSALCPLLTSPSALSFFSYVVGFKQWATQTASCLAKSGSMAILRVLQRVFHPPHGDLRVTARYPPPL